MVIDIYGNEVDESTLDMQKGRLEESFVPKPGVIIPPGKTKYDLSPDDIQVVDMYIPYTEVELKGIEAKKLADDKDSMLLEVMYQVMLLTDMIQGGSQ